MKTEDLIVTLLTGEGKRVKAKSSLSLAQGTRATVSVRPEAVRATIEESPESLTIGVSGKVADIGAETSDEVVVWADLRDEEAEGREEGLRGTIGRFGQTEQKPAFDPAALEIVGPAWKEVG